MRRRILIAIAVVIVLGASIGLNIKPRGVGNRPTIHLDAPVALADTTSFPADQAGLSAYLNVGKLDFQNLYQAVTAVSGTKSVKGSDGKGWIWVNTTVPQMSSISEEVQVYADVSGWVVAFLGSASEVARLVRWEHVDEKARASVENVLETALRSVLAQLALDFTPRRSQVRYYHFAYPKAQQLIVLVNYGHGSECSFLVPTGLSFLSGAAIAVSAPGSI
jgi:hypothetical protein